MHNLNEYHLLSGIQPAKFTKGEDKLTNDVAIFLKAAVLNGEFKGVFFHVPNESVADNKIDIMRLSKKKRLGLVAGVSDFVLVTKDRTIFIELKTDSGRQSENQKRFQEWSLKHNIEYYIVRSLFDLKNILVNNKIIKN